MKKLSLIIIFLLTFQNISLADTISEYEEAGLKLGKSILEIMTMDKIIESIVQKEGEKYVTVEYVPDTSIYPSLDFDYYLITFDMRNEDLKIISFTAMEYFPDDFEGCMKKQDEYMKINTKLFNLKPVDYGVAPHPNPSIVGKWRAVIFDHSPPKETSSILCYHNENDPESNDFKMGILNREFANHISVKQ